MKKIISLFIVIGFMAFLIGCHAGGHAPFINTGENASALEPAGLTNTLTFTLAEGVTLELKRCGDTDMYMGTYEVTQEQYFAIMNINPSENNGGSSEDVAPTTTANCPVEKVSWDDIMAGNGFLAELNANNTIQAYLTANGLSGYQFALPTRDQWKTACDAGTTTEDSDDNVNDRAWHWDNWGQDNYKSHDVGCKSPNAWGLYDMRGNVYEWTSTPENGNRIACGGSWRGDAEYCRSSYYFTPMSDYRSNDIGFRVALVAPSN